MPPWVRFAMWYRLISQAVYCEHCRRQFWFPAFHAHMSEKHFTCRLCRIRYINAFDEALGYLWAPDSRA